MQKWEYCAIVGITRSGGNRALRTIYPAEWHFTSDGTRIVDIVTGANGVAQAISDLGAAGWEMVGTVNTSASGEHALYFKRPVG